MKRKNIHPIPHRVLDRRIRSPSPSPSPRDVENPPPIVHRRREQTNIEKRAGKRNARAVRLSPRRRTHVIRRSRRSFRRLRLGVVVRRVGSLRGRIRVRGRRASRRASSPGHPRASHSRAVLPSRPPEPSFPECPSVFRLSERRREKEKRISDVRHVVVVTQFHPSRLFFVLFQSLDRTTERPNDRTTERRASTRRDRPMDGCERWMDGWMRSTERDRSTERCVATERCDANDRRPNDRSRPRDGRGTDAHPREAPTGGFYFYDGRTVGRTDSPRAV